MFPAQDRLTEASPLGNLIALPFQGKAMEAKHTMLLDPETGFQEPYRDQMAVLRSLLKLSDSDLDRIIEERQLVGKPIRLQEVKKTEGPAAFRTPGKIGEGARNSTLASEAGSLRRKGAEYKEILSTLLIMNTTECDPPLPETEVASIARSIASYPAGSSCGGQAITLDQALAQVKDLSKKVKADPGFVFVESTLEALRVIREQSPVEWARIHLALKGQVSLKDLNRCMAEQRQSICSLACPYEVRDGGFACIRQGQGGEMLQPLCNFTARIVREIVYDDGVRQEAKFAIEGTLADGEPLSTIEVSAGAFAGMSWVMDNWGSRPVILAGPAMKDHVRAAIQMLSREVDRQKVYSHLGWRKINGLWVYLHDGGGIGQDGMVTDISVCLGRAKLNDFFLPEIPKRPQLVEAVRASLKFLEVAPPRLTVPLLAGTYRAVLGEILDIDFSQFLAGRTGTQKSELSALVQAHFGNFHSRNLPGNWYGTANALEKLAFLAKDAVLVFDDFIPTGTVNEVSSMHSKADRLLRGQGNRSGRARMRADGNLNREFFPRGLIIATGEDVPRGHSLRGRLLILEVSPGIVDLQVLTHLQHFARDGLLAQAMAAYLQWLAPNLDDLKKTLPAEFQNLRNTAREDLPGVHDRTPDIVASLYQGWVNFLSFAQEVGAITNEEFIKLGHSGWQALVEAGSLQTQHQVSEDVVDMFLRLLESALSSGQAHLADAKTNGEPPEAANWGWRLKGNGQGAESYFPLGDRIGWLDAQNLYLEPESVFATVQKIARSQGTSLPVTPTTLWKRLKTGATRCGPRSPGKGAGFYSLVKKASDETAVSPQRPPRYPTPKFCLLRQITNQS
jgi:hypothetical protein